MKNPFYQWVLPDRVTILSKNERPCHQWRRPWWWWTNRYIFSSAPVISGDAADALSLVATLPREQW